MDGNTHTQYAVCHPQHHHIVTLSTISIRSANIGGDATLLELQLQNVFCCKVFVLFCFCFCQFFCSTKPLFCLYKCGPCCDNFTFPATVTSQFSLLNYCFSSLRLLFIWGLHFLFEKAIHPNEVVISFLMAVLLIERTFYVRILSESVVTRLSVTSYTMQNGGL